jgi:hypothetical protein
MIVDTVHYDIFEVFWDVRSNKKMGVDFQGVVDADAKVELVSKGVSSLQFAVGEDDTNIRMAKQ